MSNMIIKIVEVDPQTAKSAKGKDYKLLEITYKNMSFGGKVETKKHNQYGDKNVFDTLKSAGAGDIFTITREKDASGYWQWVGITEGEDAAPAAKEAPAKATASPKSTYETPEERAKKQVYIVRQSSITNAIETLKTDKKNPTKEEVLALAKEYEAYVFGIGTLEVEAEELPTMEEDDDIPF